MRQPLYIGLIVVFACLACIEPAESCTTPYTVVNEQCCLDEDNNGICDKDKPACIKPYVNVGNGCCLDLNDNKACDLDEKVVRAKPTTSTMPQVETSTTSTSTTASTTSTIPQNSDCVRVEDCPSLDNVSCDQYGREVYVHTTPIICLDGECVYRSSKEISAYPCLSGQRCIAGTGCMDIELITLTTTTLHYRYDFGQIVSRVAERANQTVTTTTSTLAACVDSDGGRRYYDRADTVSGPWWMNGSFTMGSERCTDDKTLIEYYCSSGTLQSKNYECPSRCLEGRCCKTEGRSCSSDSECCFGSCVSMGMAKYCVL